MLEALLPDSELSVEVEENDIYVDFAIGGERK